MIQRLKWMGGIFFALAIAIAAGCWWLVHHPIASAPLWLQRGVLPTSPDTAITYYVFSILFCLMGLCCFGGAWQRRHIIKE